MGERAVEVQRLITAIGMVGVVVLVQGEHLSDPAGLEVAGVIGADAEVADGVDDVVHEDAAADLRLPTVGVAAHARVIALVGVEEAVVRDGPRGDDP